MDEKYIELMDEQQDNCWYFVGKRELLLYWMNKFKKGNNLKILDIGCGTGVLLGYLKGRGELHGLDASKQALNACKRRGNFKLKHGSAGKLDYPKNYFDVIFLSDIIEHVENDNKVMEDCYKILKKKGIVILTVPAHKRLWGERDKKLGHKRRYSKKRLMEICKRFKVRKMSYIHFSMYFPMLFKGMRPKLDTEWKLGTAKGMLKLFNHVLLRITRVENRLLKHINFPTGVGLIAVLEKE